MAELVGTGTCGAWTSGGTCAPCSAGSVAADPRLEEVTDVQEELVETCSGSEI